MIYQVAWVREFGNVFGNTVYSASLVGMRRPPFARREDIVVILRRRNKVCRLRDIAGIRIGPGENVIHLESCSRQAPLELDRQFVIPGSVDRRLKLQRANEVGVAEDPL